MRVASILLSLGATLAAATAAAQTPAMPVSRGELLYNNHCITCHTQQMHWRALRKARDWETLKFWVRRWQAEARLDWSEEDIEAVAQHLNDTIYQFPRPQASR